MLRQQEAELIAEYKNGSGTNALAEKYGVHRATVQRVLKRNGIRLRKTSPYKRTYNVNYFTAVTPESAYWAGFIAADGCVRSDRASLEIGLAAKDTEHLEKFARAIDYQGSLYQEKNATRISVSGQWFPDSLKKHYNITPQKSLVYIFPLSLPESAMSHFARGLFDGDGGITHTTCLTVNFAGTEHVCVALQELFFREAGIRLKSKNRVPPLQKQTSGKTYAQISYSGKNALKILDWLYKDSTTDTRLDRKYERYIQAKSK